MALLLMLFVVTKYLLMFHRNLWLSFINFQFLEVKNDRFRGDFFYLIWKEISLNSYIYISEG